MQLNTTAFDVAHAKYITIYSFINQNFKVFGYLGFIHVNSYLGDPE